MQKFDTAPQSARDSSRGTGIRVLLFLVGLTSSCVVGGVLAAAPRAGLVVTLLLGVMAALLFSGRPPVPGFGRSLAWWCGATAAFGLLVTLGAFKAERQKRAAQEGAAAQARAEQVTEAAEAEALRLSAAERMNEGRTAVARARSLLIAERFDEVEGALSATLPQVSRLAALEPPVEGAEAVRGEAEVVVREAQSYAATRDAARNALADATAVGADLVTYDDRLMSHEAALRTAPAGPRAKFRREVAQALTAVIARRRSISKRVETARAAAAHHSAVASTCGERPDSTSWEFLMSVEFYLQKTAHDPDSIDVEFCSPSILHDSLCWVSTCAVRGKNAFGAKVLSRMRTSSDRRGLLTVLPFRQ